MNEKRANRAQDGERHGSAPRVSESGFNPLVRRYRRRWEDCRTDDLGKGTYAASSPGSERRRTAKLSRHGRSCKCPYATFRKSHCEHIQGVARGVAQSFRTTRDGRAALPCARPPGHRQGEVRSDDARLSARPAGRLRRCSKAFVYDHVRPHEGIGGMTPGGAAGITADGQEDADPARRAVPEKVRIGRIRRGRAFFTQQPGAVRDPHVLGGRIRPRPAQKHPIAKDGHLWHRAPACEDLSESTRKSNAY